MAIVAIELFVNFFKQEFSNVAGFPPIEKLIVQSFQKGNEEEFDQPVFLLFDLEGKKVTAYNSGKNIEKYLPGGEKKHFDAGIRADRNFVYSLEIIKNKLGEKLGVKAMIEPKIRAEMRTVVTERPPVETVIPSQSATLVTFGAKSVSQSLSETSVTFTTIDQVQTENQRRGGGFGGFIEVPEHLTDGFYSIVINDLKAAGLFESLIPSVMANEIADQNFIAAKQTLGFDPKAQYEGLIFSYDAAFREQLFTLVKVYPESHSAIVIEGDSPADKEARRKASEFILEGHLEKRVLIAKTAASAYAGLMKQLPARPHVSIAGMVTPNDALPLRAELRSLLGKDGLKLVTHKMALQFLRVASALESFAAKIRAEFRILVAA